MQAGDIVGSVSFCLLRRVVATDAFASTGKPRNVREKMCGMNVSKTVYQCKLWMPSNIVLVISLSLTTLSLLSPEEGLELHWL